MAGHPPAEWSISLSAVSDVVAVVDDDVMTRHALKNLLSSCGYTVELYESGEAFLGHAARCTAFVLLVDVQLGNDSGFDFARRLAKSGFKFPIIFMTENDNQELRRLAGEAGGVGCLLKPFVPKLLMHLLTKSTSRR